MLNGLSCEPESRLRTNRRSSGASLGNCLICAQIENSYCEIASNGRDDGQKVFFEFLCTRCGRFEIELSLRQMYPKGLAPDKGLRLSNVLQAATRRNDVLSVSRENLEALVVSSPVPVTGSAYFSRTLLVLAEYLTVPGTELDLSLPPIAALTFLTTTQLSTLLTQMMQEGLIGIPRAHGPLQRTVTLLAKGWARVDEMQRRRPASRRAFVAMWFDASIASAYKDGIRAALVDCGYEPPFRVDDPEHDQAFDSPDYQRKIDDRIMAEIRGARFVVADVTEQRPAVYFEAGFAEGLGIPVIYTCREGSDLCFDTRQSQHLLWTEPADLRESLVARLGRLGLTLKGAT